MVLVTQDYIYIELILIIATYSTMYLNIYVTFQAKTSLVRT